MKIPALFIAWAQVVISEEKGKTSSRATSFVSALVSWLMNISPTQPPALKQALKTIVFREILFLLSLYNGHLPAASISG
jgi:hypothetical protein